MAAVIVKNSACVLGRRTIFPVSACLALKCLYGSIFILTDLMDLVPQLYSTTSESMGSNNLSEAKLRTLPSGRLLFCEGERQRHQVDPTISN